MARADLALVVVDTGALAAGVAECLGIEPHYEVVPGIPSAWGLGTYRPSLGVEVPAYLTAQRSDDGLESAVRALGAFAGGSFGVVLPTRNLLRPTIVALVQQLGGHVIALSDDASITDDGGIAARRPIETIWAPCVKAGQSVVRLGDGIRQRQARAGTRAVALSQNAQRLLVALQKHAGSHWPGTATLCAESGKRSAGGSVTPMHSTLLPKAVRELVDAGYIDLRGKSRVRKGDGWDLMGGGAARKSRKS